MLLIPAFVDPANGNLVQDGVLGRGRHFCRCRAVRSMDAFAVRYLLNGIIRCHSPPSYQAFSGSTGAKRKPVLQCLCMCFFLVFGFFHTAFKLSSLWHVGYVLDDFYGFQMCSRADLLMCNSARCPDSIEPPQLLGSMPSYLCMCLRTAISVPHSYVLVLSITSRGMAIYTIEILTRSSSHLVL
jgi:hypothetical protein